MNDIINELLAKATYDVLGVKQVDQKLFAKLIVLECANLVEGFELSQEIALDEYMDFEAKEVLMEHFGFGNDDTTS